MRSASIPLLLTLAGVCAGDATSCEVTGPGCGVPRASLMQIKSLSKRREIAGQGGSDSRSEHARTLAGFQRYVEDAAQAMLTNPRENNFFIGDDIFQLIHEFMQMLDETFRAEHEEDKNRVSLCNGACDACRHDKLKTQDVYGKMFLNDEWKSLEELNTSAVSLFSEHTSCRQQRYTNCTAQKCKDYDNYRQTRNLALPPCVDDGKFGASYLGLERVESETTQDASHYHIDWVEFKKDKIVAVGSCLEALNLFLNHDLKQSATLDYSQAEVSSGGTWESTGDAGLWKQYQDCTPYRVQSEYLRTNTCKTTQGDFERAAQCASDLQGTTKHHMDACWDAKKRACDAEMLLLEVNVNQRKNDNRTANHISCLLRVLTSFDQSRPETIIEGLNYCKAEGDLIIDDQHPLYSELVKDYQGDDLPTGDCTKDSKLCLDFGKRLTDMEATWDLTTTYTATCSNTLEDTYFPDYNLYAFESVGPTQTQVPEQLKVFGEFDGLDLDKYEDHPCADTWEYERSCTAVNHAYDSAAENGGMLNRTASGVRTDLDSDPKYTVAQGYEDERGR